MTHICDVEVEMAADGTYRAAMVVSEMVIEEVWGRESIPDVIRALADEIERKAKREFTRVFEEDGS